MSGFRIGQVRAVGNGEGLQRRVLIETAVDFRTLEEVLVLTGDGPGPAVEEPPPAGAVDGGGS